VGGVPDAAVGEAAFLQSWRNGDESFYEGLDRTAGTKDSVFFFDAMLGDFRGLFAGGASDGGATLPGGPQQAHDALHDAFLAYRQYRGFREAVAHALVLPPDVPLPARLHRYEERVAGGYSLRQQVVMVQATMIERAGSTDAFLERAETERRELATTLTRTAAELVQRAADPKAH
jgi:hypothetical protein